jgi:four helix bundle protein
LSENKEFVLSRQLLRSGTSIGANVREAEHAQSKADFIHKLSIALKEANETEFLTEVQFQNYKIKIIEILRLLTSIINTSKNR